MADTASGDDRLPWLDAPRPAAVRSAPAARRTRLALLWLLGLFLACGVAVMAYLAGRTSGPNAVDAPRAEYRAPVGTPAPVPPPVPIALPPAVEASAAPVAEPARAQSPRRHAAHRKVRHKVRTHRSGRRHIARRAPAAVVVHRGTTPAPAVPSAYVMPQAPPRWPTQPFERRGRVIQLGAYQTPALAESAWGRLWRAYPYLGTLPRVLTIVRPTPSRPGYYRLRLAAGSGREARALCTNLHRIGRGCRLVP